MFFSSARQTTTRHSLLSKVREKEDFSVCLFVIDPVVLCSLLTRYMLGKYFIGKYRLRKDFISCDAPLLREPPPSIVKIKHQVAPDGSKLGFKSDKSPKRHAFMLCELIPGLNQASDFFKRHHCPNGANFNKTYIFHDSIED